MPTRIIYDADSEPKYPHRVLLVWRTFIADRYDFTEASQWFGLLMTHDDRVRIKITALDEHGADYIVAINRSIFFQPYHATSQRLIRVCSYLLFNDNGNILNKLLEINVG